jgi:hypothetical protein
LVNITDNIQPCLNIVGDGHGPPRSLWKHYMYGQACMQLTIALSDLASNGFHTQPV